MKKLHIFSTLIVILISTVPLLLKAQDPSNSIPQLEKKLASCTKDDSVKISILLDLTAAFNFQDTIKVRVYGAQAISTARNFKNTQWTAKALIAVSNSLQYLADYKNAAILLLEALDISKSNNLPLLEIRALNNLGSLYANLGSTDKGLGYILEAYNLSQKLNKPKLAAQIFTNIALYHIDLHEYEKVVSEAPKNIEFLRKEKDWVPCILNYINLGQSYGKLGKFPQALVAFDSCQQLISRYNLQMMAQVNLTAALANMYLEDMNQPDKAISSILELYAIPQLAIPPMVNVLLEQTLADAYLKQKNTSLSIKHAIKSDSIVINFGLTPNLSVKSKMILAKCYANLNDLDKAYRYAMESSEIEDSIEFQERRQKSIFSLIGHEIESNEKELTLKNNKLAQTKRVYQILLVVLIPLLILLAAAIFYRIKLKQSKEKAAIQEAYTKTLEQKVKERTLELESAHNTIQEAKERENISLAILNQEHAELLEVTIKKMETWQKQSSVEEFQPAINELKNAKNKADEWGSFMMHFERIHPSFTQTLQSMYPELNANDLRHCAYIKLGMSRKQVADSLHSTENAVKLTRNRIKKKMDLSAEDSLRSHISSIQG